MFAQDDFYQAEPDIVADIMIKLSLNAVLKEWGDKAFTAAQSEMKQWRELIQVQQHNVLESHMSLKQKRDGKIKVSTVAGGNKQHDYIFKEDVGSMTITTYWILLSCIIDAEEERDIAVVDIPTTFVQTHVENEKDMMFIKI
jgi:hypothetical protein